MELIPVHANQDELMYLDILQGGPSFDDHWRIREYSKLEPLFKEQKFIDMIIQVLDQIGETGDIEEQFVRLREALNNEPIEFVDAPGDSNPEIQQLAALGTGGGDDRIALFPQSVIDVFKEIVGENINPESGLYQFFFPILAAIIAGATASAAGAGTIGTALAAGAGSFVGSKLTGARTKDALKQAGITAATAGIMPHVGSAFSNAFPGAAGVMKNMSSSILGPNITGALGAALTGTGPEYAEAKKAAEASQAAQGMQQAASEQQHPLAQQNSGIFGGNLPLLALGGAYMHHQAKKQEKQYRREKQDFENAFRNRGEELVVKPYTAKPYEPKYKQNPRDLTLYDSYGNLNYKRGGLVHGHSKGQEDNRPFKLKEGSYVINATNVADLGDGNTIAGNKEIDRFLSKIKARNDGHNKTIDVMLSDGERVIDRDVVNALGKGSNDHGAKILDTAFKKLRKHKTSNGLALPPKAYRLEKYLKR